MTSEISISRILFVHIQGDPLIGEERRSAFARALREAADANLDIVIHDDASGAQPLTATDYLARAHYLGVSDFKKRIAYVPPPGFPPSTCELIENAAWNEARKVKLFSRVEDAIRWIEGREDDTA
jgi:hypothetical protein